MQTASQAEGKLDETYQTDGKSHQVSQNGGELSKPHEIEII